MDIHVMQYQKESVSKMVNCLTAAYMEKLVKAIETDRLTAARKIATVDEQRAIDSLVKLNEEVKAIEEKFGAQIDSLAAKRIEKEINTARDKTSDFEARISKAIGQVVLVSPEAAYETIQAARAEVDQLD